MFGNILWAIIGNRFGAVVIGLVMLISGPIVWDTSEVTCGSRTIKPGDTCITTRRGNSVERSYGEQRAYDERFRLAWMAAGGILLVGGAVRIVVKLRRRDPVPTANPTGTATS